MRVDAEIASLFGRELVNLARRTDVVDLDLEADYIDGLADAAEELLQVKGQSEKQRKMVDAMSAGERLALCMWMLDTDMAVKLVQ